jgi:thymidylate synthase (FAD)
MRYTVLDGGYLELIEAWGHGKDGVQEAESTVATNYEVGIIEAARQSTQGSFRGWEDRPCLRCDGQGRITELVEKDTVKAIPVYSGQPTTRGWACAACGGKGYLPGDQRLLRTLYLNDPQHATPFEFSGMTIELEAPLIVFREWHRHRTQSYNEMSARYAPMPDNNYVPDWEVLKQRGEAAEKSRNKQEKGTHPWNEVTAQSWWRRLPEVYSYLEKVYNDGLLAGVPKELARLVIPVGRYSRMRASANLRNWLAFVTLRYDPQAQWEIRQYAKCVADILAETFPKTWELYVEKKSPEHQLTKFNDSQIKAECVRRGIQIMTNFKEDVR